MAFGMGCSIRIFKDENSALLDGNVVMYFILFFFFFNACKGPRNDIIIFASVDRALPIIGTRRDRGRTLPSGPRTLPSITSRSRTRICVIPTIAILLRGPKNTFILAQLEDFRTTFDQNII